MNSYCPLPVDWLDYLEGEANGAMGEHLSGCASCETLVRTMESHPPAVPAPQWIEGVDRPSAPAWKAQPAEGATFGQVCLATGAGKSAWMTERLNAPLTDALLVLITGDAFEEAGQSWVPAVPLRSDVEDATLTDYLMTADETSLGFPLRLVFSHQDPIQTESLVARVGSLVASAEARLHEALEGNGGPDRWGTAVGTAAGSSRYDHHWSAAVSALRSPWLSHLADSSSEVVADSPHNVWLLRQPAEGSGESTGVVHWLRPRPAQEVLAFAAKASEPTAADVWAMQEPFELEGRLRTEWSTARLLFRVLKSHCEPSPCRVRLVAHVKDDAQPWRSEPFLAEVGTEVPLGEGRFPHDVVQLGAEVSE